MRIRTKRDMLGNIIPYLQIKSTLKKHKKPSLSKYSFLSRKEVASMLAYAYADKKGKGGKGISIVNKIKSVLRKSRVNGLVMRMASVLKQNKYRKK